MRTSIIFEHWHFMRWLRLGLGILIAVQAIYTHDILSGIIAFFFLFQAVTNTGCCSSTQCYIPPKESNVVPNEKITFEEIKNK